MAIMAAKSLNLHEKWTKMREAKDADIADLASKVDEHERSK